MDRFMIVEAGWNYGWPDEIGFHDNREFINPRHVWTETVSPAGMLTYQGDQFPDKYKVKLFYVLIGYAYSEGPNANGKRNQLVTLNGKGLETEPLFEDFAIWNFDEQSPNNPVDIVEGHDVSIYGGDIFQNKIFRISYSP